MKRLIGVFCGLLFLAGNTMADEGVWLPHLLGKYNIADMKKQGFKLTAEDLYSINSASIKDAIVHFGGGCTGELISSEGLIITNHHCGLGNIQSHSSIENDYISNGFWAMSKDEELPNANLAVVFLVKIEDVTSRALMGVTQSMDEAEREMVIAANCRQIADSAMNGNHYSARVAPMFYGNQFLLFVNEVFRDVRLVGAPPKSIGNFGGDTDNWTWPRHTGDFSLFRIYADKNNQPASYSPDNVPYKPKKFLPISVGGVKENDFTLVYGYPGTTQQFITSYEVDYLVNHSNPLKIDLRTKRLEIMDEFMMRNDTVRIQYTSKHAGVANAWKKWMGERNGLLHLKAVEKKQQAEADFAAWAASKNGPGKEYAEILPQLAQINSEMRPLLLARDLEREAFKAVEILRLASSFSGLVAEAMLPNPDTARIGEMATWMLRYAKGFYKDYFQPIDKSTFAVMMQVLHEKLPPHLFPKELEHHYQSMQGNWKGVAHLLFKQSILADSSLLLPKLRYFGAASVNDLLSDPLIKISFQFDSIYSKEVNPQLDVLYSQSNALYRTYVKGIMQMQPSRTFYPDANSTLRVAYGKVLGYSPLDAVEYSHITTLDGVIEKSKMGVYDYVVPDKLSDLHARKDYGRWAVNGTVPVGFIANNHTSGGNSGSPVLNSKGQLVGVNFDRVWEGTMSDIMFDPAICRNISLDIRYALFIIDKFAGANHLLKEMQLVE